MPVFRISHKKNKKYDVWLDGKWISFGDQRYEHYKTSDEIPRDLHIYPEHDNLERRRRYHARASKIVDKDGNLTANDPHSANYWSIRYLW